MRSTFLAFAVLGGFALFGRALQAQDGRRANPIVSLDPALDTIMPAGAKLEKIADGFIYFEGRPSLDGPVWIKDGGYLLFSYMSGHALDKLTSDGNVSLFLDLDPQKTVERTTYIVSAITLDPQGRVVYCLKTDPSIMRIEKDGSRTVLAHDIDGQPLNPPNDLVYKSDGTLYVTTPGKLPDTIVFLKDGKLHNVENHLSGPNGIALSPDEKYLYVNDIGKKTVWRFDLQDDSPVNGRIWVDMNSDHDLPGGPDGMKVDLKGNVYDSGPGGLWILSPDGKHLGTILTPTPVSNLAWGDADGETLYITTHTAIYRIRLSIEGLRP